MKIKRKGKLPENLTEDQIKRLKIKLNEKSDKSTACWEYEGYEGKFGYILITFDGYYVKAHRASYMVYKGFIPKELQVCHTCDNRKCVNPDHLWLGTAKDNAVDRNKKKRNADFSGSKNGCSKLTENEVKGIKKMLIDGKTSKEIRETYNISTANLYCIRHGLSWSTVN